MKLTDYTIYDKHITKEMRELTDSDIAARQKAQSALMNEDAFAIVFDGLGRTEFVVPRYFDGSNAVHLHQFAIAKLMHILTCTGCTRVFLGLDDEEGCDDDDGYEELEHRGSTH